MKTSIIAIALLCLASTLSKAEQTAGLDNGNYSLVFTEVSFTKPAPAAMGQTQAKEIIMPAILSSQDSEILIKTKTPDGTSHTMHGRVAEHEVSFWMSGFERDHMVTYHLTGTNTDADDASGKLSIFMGHEKVAAGKWRLQKTN